MEKASFAEINFSQSLPCASLDNRTANQHNRMPYRFSYKGDQIYSRIVIER